ncbi:hypothetical protein HNR46_001490 [Haloferula luteola]|uniref:LTD domain-containing protein n=1 Tax=Haloferula luteola TaxID=595692 RepID=A0A840V6K7_9BACT|nr:lamin tail domain-containing protein [Haloferula luteola]MBB5351254.1 hypothetical protein [Haloferula luteola]
MRLSIRAKSLSGLLPILASAPLYSEEPAVRINEFLASNQSIQPDNADFDDYSDWIELHNPGNAEVALDNFYLTDDLGAPTQWRFPAGTSIAAGGFLVVRADGFDAGPGETHLRGYYPWGSTFTTRRHHASFKLSADGEAIGLYRLDSPPTEETLISRHAIWSYRDLGTDPGAGWTGPGYDDDLWSSGTAPLGYGDSWVTTLVSYGADSSSKFATTYYRRHFSITDPAAISRLSLSIMADDAAVVYLNGIEVARLRMPQGTPSHDQYSGTLAPTENIYEELELAGLPLVAGDNVVAVEVHQESPTSSDTSFDLEMTADVLTAPAVEVDSVSFGPQTTDVSQGRDSSDQWVFFGTPTPGAPNLSSALVEPIEMSPEPTASMPSGFYETSLTVELGGTPSGSIHFTLDGSDPGPTSPIYATPLELTTTSILRSRVIEEGKIPGPILTRSYFLGSDADPQLPVVSFVADPATLFDDDIGIYANSSPYPFKGREIPLRLEFFEADRQPAFAVNAGTRIAGENIWLKAQKPFNVYCRGKYGDDAISYALFPGEPSATIGEFNLRNGGDDWEETLLRDAMMPSMLSGQMDASYYTYRPCVLYLNGEFWGIYNIRKRLDSTAFATEHHLSADDYDLVQYAHDENGVTRLTADTGSTDRYQSLLDLVTTQDPADSEVWAQIESQVNIDSFIDYVIATDFAVNTSWSHNREFWKGHSANSRWEWIINDFDRGFDTANLSGSLIDNFLSSDPLFSRLARQPAYVDRLIQRYAAHLGSTFLPDRFDAILDDLSSAQEGELDRHIDRWSAEGGIASRSSRQDQLDEIKQFVRDRPGYALDRLELELGLNRDPASLTFGVVPTLAGTLRIAGVPMRPAMEGTVELFQGTPVEFTAQAAPGYRFVAWRDGSTDPIRTLSLTGATTLTAQFEEGAETVLPLRVDSDLHLTENDSPYVVDGNLIVTSSATLTIDPGVTLLFTAGSSILVHGTLLANGTEAAPIDFQPRDSAEWGNLGFANTSTPSRLSHVVLRGATVSRVDPLNLKAAISGFHAELEMDHVDIEGPQPIFARHGSTHLVDSRIHITFTGDGINVKTGEALVERCTFTGNASVDTDAIDYDGVLDGIIRDNRIFNFRGDNSDGIDVGEGCVNLIVEKNRIYNNSDKGVSVGQGSEVIIRQNLIVGCALGVGIKDSGSAATIDQNTFARNDVAVAVYEKNRGAGGGSAVVTNCIFSRCKEAPVTVDALSSLAVSFSLSDSTPILGTGNIVADPLFSSPGIYDFSLQLLSPAIDAGDPGHILDPDGSRADMGMAYVYDPLDYPFLPPHVIVVNEVLSRSPGTEPDWIELYNQGSTPVDLSGWYLSDQADDLMRYRIPDGTLLAGGGYLVFREDANFGALSADPGVITPFALSGNGDTVHLFKPASGLDLEYHEIEDFGASEAGVTFGRYDKSGSGTTNFVAMKSPTPGARNSPPKVGPIVISEIMYHPESSADAEYLELLNISAEPVTLYDETRGAAWSITNGIEYTFPTSPPLTLPAGGRLILTRSLSAFQSSFSVAEGTPVYPWTSGGLSNSGETLELGKPGELDENLSRTFIRVDRINYQDTAPWPLAADGDGPGLERINPFAYGNDFSNWQATAANPGWPTTLASFHQWALDSNLPLDSQSPTDDPDHDGRVNLLEYAFGSSPSNPTHSLHPSVLPSTDVPQVVFPLESIRDDLWYTLQWSPNLDAGSWETLENIQAVSTDSGWEIHASAPDATQRGFFRMSIEER